MTIYRPNLVDEPSLYSLVSGMAEKNFSFFLDLNANCDYRGLLAHIDQICECHTGELSSEGNLQRLDF